MKQAALGTRAFVNFMIMDIEPVLTTKEEVADIIFNSEDAELNDMLQQAKTHNYKIDYLIWKITIDINSHFESQLRENSGSRNARRSYLFRQIKRELVYYAHWY
jgi:hypothetical protein